MLSCLPKTSVMKSTRSLEAFPEKMLEEYEEFEDAELFAQDIRDRTYVKVTTQEVIDILDHEDKSKRLRLNVTKKRYKDVFLWESRKIPKSND